MGFRVLWVGQNARYSSRKSCGSDEAVKQGSEMREPWGEGAWRWRLGREAQRIAETESLG